MSVYICWSFGDRSAALVAISSAHTCCDVICIPLQVSRHRENGVYILAAVAWFGFFGFGTYPVCMELAVEVTYPVAEATSSGLLFLSA